MAKTTINKDCNNTGKQEKPPMVGQKLSKKGKTFLKRNRDAYQMRKLRRRLKLQKQESRNNDKQKLRLKSIKASTPKETNSKDAKTIDTSKAKNTFKDIQKTMEKEHPQIKMYKYTPLYLIDTDKEDIDFQQLAAYQCINRNLNSLETINMENNLDKQLKEMYL